MRRGTNYFRLVKITKARFNDGSFSFVLKLRRLIKWLYAWITRLVPQTCLLCHHGVKDICQRCEIAFEYFNNQSSLTLHDFQVNSIFLYNDAFKKMLIAYKYQNKLSAGRVLAQLIKPVVADSFENFDFIICVPLHPRKLRERGFNQVDGIMSRVLDLYGKDYGTKLNRQLVSRIHDTVSQAQSDFEKRQENLKHAFAISKPNILRDKSILVVDDVMTTGATLHELMRVVKESGARDVKGLTFARRIK